MKINNNNNMKVLDILFFCMLLFALLFNPAFPLKTNSRLKKTTRYIPRGTICINDSGCGDYICVKVNGNKFGKCK